MVIVSCKALSAKPTVPKIVPGKASLNESAAATKVITAEAHVPSETATTDEAPRPTPVAGDESSTEIARPDPECAAIRRNRAVSVYAVIAVDPHGTRSAKRWRSVRTGRRLRIIFRRTAIALRLVITRRAIVGRIIVTRVALRAIVIGSAIDILPELTLCKS
jgi:hypothetical protein